MKAKTPKKEEYINDFRSGKDYLDNPAIRRSLGLNEEDVKQMRMQKQQQNQERINTAIRALGRPRTESDWDYDEYMDRVRRIRQGRQPKIYEDRARREALASFGLSADGKSFLQPARVQYSGGHLQISPK